MPDRLNGTPHLKEPHACTENERREFARLVRQGFASADERLEGRIRDAKSLAFHYGGDDELLAVAALKSPAEEYRDDVFRNAGVHVSSADYEHELGWVFVVPACRGNRIAETLCRRLVASVPGSCVFATTRPDNVSMIRILLALDFVRTGKPYPHRDEVLVLFLRSWSVSMASMNRHGIEDRRGALCGDVRDARFLRVWRGTWGGRPTTTTRGELQVRETLRALPEALREGATVIGYEDGERRVLKAGSDEMICLADDPG